MPSRRTPSRRKSGKPGATHRSQPRPRRRSGVAGMIARNPVKTAVAAAVAFASTANLRYPKTPRAVRHSAGITFGPVSQQWRELVSGGEFRGRARTRVPWSNAHTLYRNKNAIAVVGEDTTVPL